jgi:hypothetical protein
MRRIVLLLGLLVLISPAKAADNYAATAGTGLTFGAKSIGGILYPWWIPANSSGTELFTSGNAGYVQFPSAQAVTATLGAETTKVIGTVNQGTSPWVVSNGGTFAVQAAQATAANLNMTEANSAAILSAVQGSIPAGSALIGSITSYIGSAVVSATNGSYTNLLQGNAVNASSNPIFTQNTAGSALMGKVGIDQTTPGTTNAVQANVVSGGFASGAGADGWDVTKGAKADTVCGTATGTCSVVALLKYLNNVAGSAIVAGTNLIGKVGIDQTTNGTTNAVVPVPATSGGLTTYFLQPTASTNSVSVKASAGQVYWILAENNSATVNYVRFYNTSSGPTCSSATGLVTQIQIPASTAVGGISIPLHFGIAFSTGIGICVTSGYATTDTTNATATAISLTIGYN